MPYLRWLETARRFADRPAIFDGGRTVTFSELATALALRSVADAPVIARSGTMDFFVEILRAWRDGQTAIPVEKDASEPQLQRLPDAGTRLIKYTPGATGIPRGIFLDADQIMADADRIVAAMELSPDVPNLGVISLAHSYGFSNVVLPLLLHGVPVHLAAVPFPRVVEKVFRSHPAIVVPAVPSMWRAWHRSGILKGAPIRLALSAGAPLALALESEVFAASGVKIRNFYGASECGGISLDTTDAPRDFASDVGTPLPGVDVSFSQDGRIVIKSSSVAGGYDSDRTEDVLGSGVYQTRDHGFFDPAGRLHLTGTTGGAINVAGRKISPTKVEAALLTTGMIERVSIFAIASSDPERFEEIAARVDLKQGITLEDLKKAAAGVLQNWEVPRHWRINI